MDIEKALMTLGLDPNQQRVYIAALELGQAPVTQVALKAGLGRTTAYAVLDRLAAEGMVRFVPDSSPRQVVAEDPGIMLRRLEDRRLILGEALPVLRSLYNASKAKPKINYFDGVDGIRTVLWDTLSCRSPELLGILAMNELIQTPGLEEFDLYIAERVRRALPLRVIRSTAHESGPIWSSSASEYRELRYAPPHVDLGMTMYLYDDKIGLISTQRENFGMIIESKEFTLLQRALFESLWLQSTP